MTLRDIDKNTVIMSRTPYKNDLTEATKDKLREILEADVERFLKAGGEIQKIDYQVTGKKEKKGRFVLEFRSKLQ